MGYLQVFMVAGAQAERSSELWVGGEEVLWMKEQRKSRQVE